jgi:hypothetical protein
VSRIELTGLRGDLPIGPMAAFGVLRICTRSKQLSGPRLCWSGNEGDYRAALVTENNVNVDDLVSVLVADVRCERTLPQWEQVKTITADEFRSVARDAAPGTSQDDRERADWMMSLANELVKGNEDKVQSTPFDMSVARQKFLADAVRLASTLGADNRGRRERSTEDQYKEALFGPWRYQDDQHSLGWDPTTIKLGAFTHRAPTGMASLGVRAAVWLAFESLPLFPCFYSRGLQTRGLIQSRRAAELRWPIWRQPIGVPELATLLGWAALYLDTPSRAEMKARGVAAVYRSERFKPNQYMVTFRSPELVYSEA